MFATNQIKETKTIQLTFTADGTADDLSHAAVMNAAGKGFQATLPTGVTMSGPLTWAQLQDVLHKTPIRVSKITIRTSNQAEVFASYCQHGKIKFNGDVVTPEKIYLDGYATSSNGTYDPTLFIKDKGFLVSPQDFFTVPVKKSGATTVILEYDYEQDGVVIPTEKVAVVN